jgi:hypothetical protein
VEDTKLKLTSNIRPHKHPVNIFWDTKATIATLASIELIDAAERAGRDLRVNEYTA